MDLPHPGAYSIWITAVNHTLMEIPLVVDKHDSKIALNIVLKPYDFKNFFDEVKIIGSWNNFNWNIPAMMQKQLDGTFVYELAAPADTIGYQLLEIVESGSSVNGTSSDYYEFDGSGDYISKLVSKDRKFRIVFDPAKLPHTQDADLPRVSFDKKHPHLGELFGVAQRTNQQIQDYRKSRSSYEKEHGTNKGFSYDFSPLQTYLAAKIRDANHAAVKQMAGMHLAYLYYFGVRLGSEVYADIAANVPPTSAMWTLALRPVALGMGLHELEVARTLLENIYRQNSDRTIQATALAQLAFLAALQGDETGYRALFTELQNKYADISDIESDRITLDPDSPIAWGKPAPVFQIKLLDQSSSISNKSLLGRYYLIDFWATWCGPCREEMANLHDAFEKYQDHNFTIVSLSLDRQPNAIENYRKKGWAMPWHHAFITDGWQSQLVEAFSVHMTGIPSPFLISPEGKILASHDALRGGYLERTLAKYLGTN